MRNTATGLSTCWTDGLFEANIKQSDQVPQESRRNNLRIMDKNGSRILIADDQPDVREALRLLLKGEGYQTETVSSPAGILKALESGDFQVLLMDLNYSRDTTSGKEGLDVLSRIQAMDSTLPVVVMTAWGN